MKWLIAAAAGLAICASAHANTTSAPQTSATESADRNSDAQEVICKKQKPPTGSRLSRKEVCATRSQWAQIAEDARRTTQDIQGQGKYNMDKGD